MKQRYSFWENPLPLKFKSLLNHPAKKKVKQKALPFLWFSLFRSSLLKKETFVSQRNSITLLILCQYNVLVQYIWHWGLVFKRYCTGDFIWSEWCGIFVILKEAIPGEWLIPPFHLSLPPNTAHKKKGKEKIPYLFYAKLVSSHSHKINKRFSEKIISKSFFDVNKNLGIKKG
mgnify:FL=1